MELKHGLKKLHMAVHNEPFIFCSFFFLADKKFKVLAGMKPTTWVEQIIVCTKATNYHYLFSDQLMLFMHWSVCIVSVISPKSYTLNFQQLGR